MVFAKVARIAQHVLQIAEPARFAATESSIPVRSVMTEIPKTEIAVAPPASLNRAEVLVMTKMAALNRIHAMEADYVSALDQSYARLLINVMVRHLRSSDRSMLQSYQRKWFLL